MISFVKQFRQESVSQAMKKVISISLSILMLIAVLHLSLATHYCGGTIAASTISLSGKLASCGMVDDQKDLPQTGLSLTTHCCDNVLTSYGINSIFFPTFSFVQELYQHHSEVFIIHFDLTHNSIASIKTNSTNVSPPGAPSASRVNLSDICILRI
jgi:hypothetical protein